MSVLWGEAPTISHPSEPSGVGADLGDVCCHDVRVEEVAAPRAAFVPDGWDIETLGNIS